MKQFPPLAILAGLATVVLGLPLGLYALLTRGRRRTMREIRAAAAGRGWNYRPRRWQGNPTAFRIDGQTRAGLAWILTSGNTAGYDRGWSVQLTLRFPTLAGEPDFAVSPRSAPLGQLLPDLQEMSTGLSAFDAGYRVLVSQRRFSQPPVDAALATRILQWPADAITPHSVLAWRDPIDLQLQVRLPAPPNWATIAYAVALAEDLSGRLPPPLVPAVPPGFYSRLFGRIRS